MEYHGMSNTSEYYAWNDMKKRCYCKTYKQYKDYGGRGITVCDSWRNSFVQFISDMGEKPDKTLSLDRIDNNKDYTPENCRWATKQQQTRNQRKQENTSSKYKGVSWDKVNKVWVASITCNYKRYKLGNYKNEKDAALAWNKKAEELGYALDYLNKT